MESSRAASSSPVLAILGGTGPSGAPFVRDFLAKGMRVRLLARSPDRMRKRFPTVDVVPGTLLDERDVARCLEGADAAFLLTPMGGNDSTGIEVDAARATVAGAKAAGCPHVVYVSVIAIDRPTGIGVIDVKLEVERLIAGSGLAWSSLRAGTYMEDLVDRFRPYLRCGWYPLGFRPGRRCHMTAQRDLVEVTAALLARRTPLNGPVDVVDPRVYTLPEIGAVVARHLGRRVWVGGHAPLAVMLRASMPFLRWFAPRRATLGSLLMYFDEHDLVGDPTQLARLFPEVVPTTLEEHLRRNWR